MSDTLDSQKLISYANNSIKHLSQKFKAFTELVYSTDPDTAILRMNRVANLLNIAQIVMERNLSEEEWQELIISLGRLKTANRLPLKG